MSDHPDVRASAAMAQEIENLRGTVEALDDKMRRLRIVLRSVLDAHRDCQDETGTICASCANAMAELTGGAR